MGIGRGPYAERRQWTYQAFRERVYLEEEKYKAKITRLAIYIIDECEELGLPATEFYYDRGMFNRIGGYLIDVIHKRDIDTLKHLIFLMKGSPRNEYIIPHIEFLERKGIIKEDHLPQPQCRACHRKADNDGNIHHASWCSSLI